MELRGRRVMVIGLGVTGRALVDFLLANGGDVIVAEKDASRAGAGVPAGVSLLVGPEQENWLDEIELVVPSPGVPRVNPLLVAAVRRGLPVISELELAARFVDEITVAVTGTNGKSTVTALIGEIMKAAGRRPFVGGNLGTPLIAAIGGRFDCAVVEVSSFQLEWTVAMRPRVAVYLNLSEDHLDRYRDLADYGAAKARLFAFQREDDWAVLNRDDPLVWRMAGKLGSRVLSFGLSRDCAPESLWPADDGVIGFEHEGGRGRIAFDASRLPGRHNLSNAMAAAGAAIAAGVAPEAIERALAAFRALPHRIQPVHCKGGVRFVDDSKGTNVGAVIEALEAFAPPIILLAGGVDKGGDYTPLRVPLAQRAKALIVFGAAREKIAAALAGAVPIEIRPNLEQAVNCAWSIAAPGDTILLSPACSSFDQFANYAERGHRFEELARAL